MIPYLVTKQQVCKIKISNVQVISRDRSLCFCHATSLYSKSQRALQHYQIACEVSKIVNNLTFSFSLFYFAVVNSEECFFTLNGSTGSIHANEAKNYTTCTWNITAPTNYTVKLKFTIFHLSVNQAKIQIHDGKSKNDTVLARFSGTRQPFTIQTSGRFMMLILKKDEPSTLCNFMGAYNISSNKGQR